MHSGIRKSLNYMCCSFIWGGCEGIRGLHPSEEAPESIGSRFLVVIHGTVNFNQLDIFLTIYTVLSQSELVLPDVTCVNNSSISCVVFVLWVWWPCTPHLYYGEKHQFESSFEIFLTLTFYFLCFSKQDS